MDKYGIKETIMNFIVPLIALVASVMLYFFVIRPSMTDLPVVRAEVEQKQVLKNQLQTKLATLNKLVDFKNVLEENAELTEAILVEEPMVPELLTQVDAISSESGMEVNRLSYSFTGGRKAAEEETVAYKDVAVSLGSEGAFEQLVAFMATLENSGRMVNIESFRYSVDDDGALATSFNLTSPYLAVESNAVTDTPIDLDITSPEFVEFMAKLKALNIYEPRVDASIEIVETTIEEGEENPFAQPTTTEEVVPPTEDLDTTGTGSTTP